MVASHRNTVMAEAFRFVENGAGTYSGTFEVPDGCTIVDIIVHAEALWTAATSASLIVGDTADDNGYFDAVDLKATDLLAGESVSLTHTGGQKGADVDLVDAAAGADHIRRRMLTSTRNLTAKVVSVGAGTAGRTVVTFVYARPDVITVTQ